MKFEPVTQKEHDDLVTSDARAAFASPHLANVSRYFVQAKNWLDAMEKSYGADPKLI